MERKNYLKCFLQFCCLIFLVFSWASNSFAREIDDRTTQNLKFSIRMFSIPQTFKPEQMYISYHGLSNKKKSVCINGQVAELQEKKPLVQFIIHNPGELEKFNGINGRLSDIADFLLRYINLDDQGPRGGVRNAGNYPGNSHPNRKNMKFEFEATPTNLSGAVFFVMQI